MEFDKQLIMEILIVVFIVGLMVAISFFKTKLPIRWQLIVSCLAGLLLLTWFWGFENGETRWKILITVVVVGSIFNLVRKLLSSNHDRNGSIT